MLFWHDCVHDGQRWYVHTSEDSFLTAQSFGVNLKFMCAYVATLLTFLYLTYQWALPKLKARSIWSKTSTFKSIQTLIGGVKLARLDAHNWNLLIVRVPDFLIQFFFFFFFSQWWKVKKTKQPHPALISRWVMRAFVHQSRAYVCSPEQSFLLFIEVDRCSSGLESNIRCSPKRMLRLAALK